MLQHEKVTTPKRELSKLRVANESMAAEYGKCMTAAEKTVP